jgi:AcrR family transcriptional regulator
VSVGEPRTNADVWELKRVRTSLEIERAGLVLLSERGLDNVTVEQIAAAAGISTRTFFRYFRNVRDILTAVPVRESKRMREGLMARPPEETLLEAFHAVFQGGGAHVAVAGENLELELEAVALWSRIVRAAPDVVQAESHATSVLARELEDVVRARIDPRPDDADVVGVLSVAFAAIIWFVYVRLIEESDVTPLAERLDRAFDALATLEAAARTRAL